MTAETLARPETSEERARAHFQQFSAEHQMTVLHDDGLYRHIRFAKPGTGMYHFDLITWPGYLTVAGDIGTYTFRRLTDMFEFFRSGPPDTINPHYWSEKLADGGRDSAKSYSEDTFRAHVADITGEYADELGDDDRVAFLAHVQEELLDQYDNVAGYQESARQAIEHFTHTDSTGRTFRFSDTWEWDLTDYDHHFLLCCYAIGWGIRQYDGSRA